MKRETLAWGAAAVLAFFLVFRDDSPTLPSLPTVASLTPWWLRPRLVDGHRVAELRETIRGALARRVRERTRSRLAWTASLRRVAPAPSPVPTVKPQRADCPDCRGTGRIRTGDGISWTECDHCVPPPREGPPAEPEAEPPAKPSPVAQVPALPFPPAPPGMAGIPIPVPSAGTPLPASGPVYRQECGPNGCRLIRIR